MNRRLFGALGVVTVFTLTVGSCKNDPFSDVHGTPSAVVTNFSYLQLPIGGTANVQASVVDATATPLEIPITFTACTGDVTVAVDTSFHPIPKTAARAIVTAVTPAPSCVVVSGGGVKDTVHVAILPQAFTGTLSSTTPKGGDTLTINSTSLLKFDPATVAVSFGGAAGVAASPAPIVSKTADVVKVLVPYGANGPLTIAGIAVTYVAGLKVSLPTSATVTQTGDFWAPGDTGYASAPSMPLPAATNDSVVYLVPVPSIANDANCGEGTGSGATGSCLIFKYTANGTDSLKFTTNWSPGTNAADVSDMDTYSCGAAGVGACFEETPPGAGAGAKTPESFTIKPSAGVHYYVAEQFSTGEDTGGLIVTIKKLN
jgi:hypothetical protein